MRVCLECGYLGDEKRCPNDGLPLISQKAGEAAAAPTEHPLLGQVFEGRYRVDSLLGEGASGWVFKAEHVTMGHKVALKVLRDTFKENHAMVKRFISEARTSSQLSNPHTVRVFDFGESDDGNLFIAMEFLDGEALADILDREGALPPARAAHIARQICHSLAEAHERGLVHRDLKPENIQLLAVHGEPDYVKVLDFGIAKAIGEGKAKTRLTEMGATLGTPWYMSPEQACALDLDGRTDLYSLGVMLYEMLSGELPFDGDSGMTVLMAHVNDPPPMIPTQVDGVPIPEPLRELTMQLLAKKPERRVATAGDVAQRLKRPAAGWTGQQGVVAPPLVGEAGRLGAAATEPQGGPAVAAARQGSPTAVTGLEPAPLRPTRATPAPPATAPAPRSRVGLIVFLLLAVLALAGLVLWLQFFADPNGKGRRLRAAPDGGAGPVELVVSDLGAGPTREDAASAAAPEATGPDEGGAALAPRDASSAARDGGATGAAADGAAAGPPDEGPQDAGGAAVAPTRRAPLTRAGIQKVLRKHQGRLLGCLKDHVAAGGERTVRVTVKLVIPGEGGSSQVTVTPAAGDFGACVKRRIEAIRFPKHDRDAVIYSFPIGT